MNTRHTWSRRRFLSAGVAVYASVQVLPGRVLGLDGNKPANSRLNLAGVGVGGQGFGDINQFKDDNIAALCDVDDHYAAKAFEKFPTARRWRDYRRMLEEQKDLDGVVVATPDHLHACVSMHAMRLGKHVYCEKPLTHSVWEAAQLTAAARRFKVVTQMGNQGHSGEGTRQCVEMIQSGAIGTVKEVHCWTDRPGLPGKLWWPQGVADPYPGEPVPATLDWDLWLGVAAERPYNKLYAPFNWRGWWDYGCGALGDMACHVMDPAWWALKLGEARHYSVEVVMQEGMTQEGCPLRSTIKYTFPARAGMPPVTLYWYDGFWGEGDAKKYNRPPHPAGVPAEEEIGDGGNGSLFYGSNGILTSGTYGGESRLLPAERMKDYQRPAPTLARVPEGNHYQNWVRACKGEEEATGPFDYSAPFTEMVLLGNVALLAGAPLEYNTRTGKITNNEAANALLTKEYRPGFELPV